MIVKMENKTKEIKLCKSIIDSNNIHYLIINGMICMLIRGSGLKRRRRLGLRSN